MTTRRGRRRPLPAYLARGLAAGIGIGAVLVARRWLDVVEVEGESMAPTLRPGDWLVVERRTYLRRMPLPGEIVVAPDPRDPRRELVKRVVSVDGEAWTVELGGDRTSASTDSRTFGAVPAATVRWRAVWRYWPLSRTGRPAGRNGERPERARSARRSRRAPR
jgi:nickel-type superoxide dismutase maturation protease